MQLFDDKGQESKSSFDSAISVYEAFTGQQVEDKEILKENRKTKKSMNVAEQLSSEKVISKEDLTLTTSTKEKIKGKKSEKSSTKSKKAEEADPTRTSSKTSQKPEEQSTVIGMGTMDMLPLILGWYIYICFRENPIHKFHP